jgi:predicted MFS family arabinose efflux permease
MVGHGVLYYSFAALLQPMTRALGASMVQVAGALTVSVLVGGAVAVPVGRWQDHHGGWALMTTGSTLATGLVVAWSQVRTIGQLYAVLTGIGLTAAMVLYPPAFAVVVSTLDPPQRSRGLFLITFVAGFASSIFLPLTTMLAHAYGWRAALLVLAVCHGLTTVPLHACALPRRSIAQISRCPRSDLHRESVRLALADGRFWILVCTFTTHAVATSAMAVHLIGYLTSRGHPATRAATIAGLLGMFAVAGRLVLTGARRRSSTTTVVAVLFVVQALSVLAMPSLAASPFGAVVTVTGFGLGFGLANLATPILLTERYAGVAYATIAGILATPVTIARATGPLVAAALHQATGGYGAVLLAIGTCCAAAAIGVVYHQPQDSSHNAAFTNARTD